MIPVRLLARGKRKTQTLSFDVLVAVVVFLAAVALMLYMLSGGRGSRESLETMVREGETISSQLISPGEQPGSSTAVVVRNQLDTMIGCASIPMQHQGEHGMVGRGHAAASIWRQVRQSHLAAIEYHVTPRLALPVEQLDDSLDVEPPALIKGYLRLGARVLGAPAWDPDFNTADLLVLLPLAHHSRRHARHFLGRLST